MPNHNFDQSSEKIEQEKQLRKIKKQWQQQQRQKFQKIQHSQLQKKNSKSVTSLLISIALFAFSVPILWKITQDTFSNTLTVNSDLTNDNGQNGKSQSGSGSPNILDKLKALEKRSQTGDFESDCVETPAATVCQSGQNNSVNNSNTNTGSQSIEQQVDQSLNQINEYNRRLKEVMDGS